MNENRKYKIAFFAPTALPFDGDSINIRPLGGLESNITLLAKSLSENGHNVKVYTPCKNIKESNNVNLQYKNLSSINELFEEKNLLDVLIVVKDLQSILVNIPCRARMFLTTDGFNEISTFGIGDKRYHDRIHVLLGGSKWHITSLCNTSGFPNARAVALGHGINLSDFKGTERRGRKRLIFTAAPFKGLELTLKIINELREQDREIEFHSFSAFNLYDTDTPFDSQIQEKYKKVNEELEKIPGVFIHGNILQKELAREYMKSAVLLYPCTWGETGARTVIEAQAAGCPIVTSSLGALPEIVGNAGFIINERVGSEEYFEKFKMATMELLTNDELWSKISLNGKMRAKNTFASEMLVERFEKILERLNLPK